MENLNLPTNDSAIDLNYGYLTLSVVPLTAVFGNILVIACVVLNRHLKQHLTNRLIASLAFCDLAVGLLVMPFAIFLKVNNDKWMLGDLACRAYVSMDISGCTASILNLLVISCDRYCAVVYPVEYQCRGYKCSSKLTLLIIWLISILIAVPVVAAQSTVDLEHCSLQNAHYMIYSSMLSFYIPAGALAFLYIKLFQRLKRRERFREAMKQFSSLAHMVKSTFQPPVGDEDGTKGPIVERALPTVADQSSIVDSEYQKESCTNGYQFSAKSYYNILANCDPAMRTNTSISSSDVSSVIDSQKINNRSDSFRDKVERKLQIQNLINKGHHYYQCQNRQNQARRVVSLNYYGRPQIIWSNEKFDDGRNQVAVHRHHHSMHHHVNFQDQDRSSTTMMIMIDSDSDSRIPGNQRSSFRKKAIMCQNEKNCKKSDVESAKRHKNKLSSENSHIYSSSACSDVTELSHQAVGLHDDELDPSRHRPKNDSNGRFSHLSKTCRNFRESWSKRSRISQAFDDLSKAVVKRLKKMSNLQKERKATKFVAIVLAAFVICWSPFFLFNALMGVCLTATDGRKDQCQFIPSELMCLAVWLGYANSCLNPILYAMLNRQFRASYKIILGRLWCRNGKKRM